MFKIGWFSDRKRWWWSNMNYTGPYYFQPPKSFLVKMLHVWRGCSKGEREVKRVADERRNRELSSEKSFATVSADVLLCKHLLTKFLCVCVCVCVCLCVRVYVVYEDTNLFNNMGMTELLQFEGGLWGHCLCPRNSKGLKNILNGVFLKI